MSDRTLRPRPRAIGLVGGFVRLGMQETLAYRSQYWAQLVNMVVKVGGIVVVWRTLFAVAPDKFPIDRLHMVTYAVLGMVLSELFDWWNGPHFYLAERIRLGTITGDLLRPVSFPTQLLLIWLGETLGTLVTVVAPVMVVAVLAGQVAAPAGTVAALAFAVSLCLSYVLLFCCSFLVGMIVLRTLNLLGIMHVYHAVLTLFTGFWIPLWFFPTPLRVLADVLPFRDIFYTPLTLYIGYTRGTDVVWALAHQVGWLAVLLLAVHAAWRFMRRRLEVQGG
jgi:ABC-2 type transport system permease protein